MRPYHAKLLALAGDAYSLVGNERSGNYGHAGRKGQVGGSAPKEGGSDAKAHPIPPGYARVDRIRRLVPDVLVPLTPTAVRTAKVIADVLEEMDLAGVQMPDSVTVNLVEGDIEARIEGKRIKPRDVDEALTLPKPQTWKGKDRTHTLHLVVDIPRALPDDADLDAVVASTFSEQSEVSPKHAHKDTEYPHYDRFAARTMQDIVVHEMGHVQAGHRGGPIPGSNQLVIGTGRLSPAAEGVRRAAMRVSEYASQSADEFLAEAYTRLYRGETLADDSMALYEKLGGPTVTKSLRASVPEAISLEGNERSGNYGHSGRPGEVGGSGPGGVTTTPAFKQWFGDSKVVNEQGEPLRVYHGTTKEFEAFTKSSDLGYHFGTAEQANYRSDNPGGRLVPVFLSIQNPVRMPDHVWDTPETAVQWATKHGFDKDGALQREHERHQADVLEASERSRDAYHNKTDAEYRPIERAFRERQREHRTAIFKSFVDALQAQGHDGIVYKNEVEGTGDSYIAFKPSQVKSAIGNRGTFDPTVTEIAASERFLLEGNEHSGNYGHSGRPGEVGGSGPSTAAHLAKLIDKIAQPDGGFTVHTTTGEIPTEGFALSLFKGRETVIPVKDVSLKDLVAFAKANADLLTQDGHYFGAWHNPEDGNVYLDISKVVPHSGEAEQLGRAHDQLAYFDLKEGKSVEIAKTPKPVLVPLDTFVGVVGPRIKAQDPAMTITRIARGDRWDAKLTTTNDANAAKFAEAGWNIGAQVRRTTDGDTHVVVVEDLPEGRKALHGDDEEGRIALGWTEGGCAHVGGSGQAVHEPDGADADRGRTEGSARAIRQVAERLFALYGTASSGNYGHAGRPGQVGGSGEGDGTGAREREADSDALSAEERTARRDAYVKLREQRGKEIADPELSKEGEAGGRFEHEHQRLAAREAVEARLHALLPLDSESRVKIASPLPNLIRTAEQVAEVLEEMKAKGMKMPNRIEILHSESAGPSAQVRTVAVTEGFGRTAKEITRLRDLLVHIPRSLPEHVKLDDIVHATFGGDSPKVPVNDPDYEAYDRFTARTMREVVIHEMGHIQTGHLGGKPLPDIRARTKGTGEMTPRALAAQRAAMRVSHYATRNTDEFIAEAFTRLYRGETLAADSMKLYRKLGGPVPPKADTQLFWDRVRAISRGTDEGVDMSLPWPDLTTEQWVKKIQRFKAEQAGTPEDELPESDEDSGMVPPDDDDDRSQPKDKRTKG